MCLPAHNNLIIMNIKLTYIFAALLLLASVAHAQINVSGRVTGADGEALIGATVAVQGAKGAVTDLEGRYQVSAPSADAELVFSYIGMRTRTEKVGDRRVIDVVLEENNALIDEVVVVGYGSQKRSNISGSVSTVTAAEIAETPVLRIEQALQGHQATLEAEVAARTRELAAAPRAADPAIADKGGRLVVPFVIGVIERILQHGRRAAIVFGRGKNIPVERGDLPLPFQRNLICRRKPVG